jgi:chromosome segregation ATPase
MPEYVTRKEFEARVGVLEQEVEGEKMVTRHVLEQTRHNGDDLAALKTRLDRVERKLDGHDRRFDEIAAEIRSLKTELQGLMKSLPSIVGRAMRDVLRERPAKE